MESKWTSRATGEVHFSFYRLLDAMGGPHPSAWILARYSMGVMPYSLWKVFRKLL